MVKNFRTFTLLVMGLVAASVIFSASPVAAQSCPTGTYPWVDTWGNNICKRFSDGSAATTQTPEGRTCPNGSHPWVDSWGNKVCRSFDQPKTDYYDTSKGCPTGTYPWADEWGNKICKRF